MNKSYEMDKIFEVDKSLCIGCGSCIRCCPVNFDGMGKDAHSLFLPAPSLHYLRKL